MTFSLKTGAGADHVLNMPAAEAGWWEGIRRRAALTCADRATDAADLRGLLEVLGLDRPEDEEDVA